MAGDDQALHRRLPDETAQLQQPAGPAGHRVVVVFEIHGD
ncbi:hypothetical protein HU200_020641 [Digitaria exilis]|uniref:Uncharacterized protein n=1 Tax=Digitaria exilis TaxID=1010633 RepID=A0A835KAL3_9POAL|nr:hypothetical protein HU200_020641 [Digitaria exilis]